jgi:hypothetical protein
MKQEDGEDGEEEEAKGFSFFVTKPHYIEFDFPRFSGHRG